MSATAERYGQRPSTLLGIPPTPEWAWASLCLDEALHFHHAKWADRRDRQRDAEREGVDDPSGGHSLYHQIKQDPRVGRPPGIAELRLLPTIEPEHAADAS